MTEHYGGARAARLRKLTRETYGDICHLCGQPIAEGQFSADHLIPRSLGGTDDIGNLRPAHRRCNSRRGNRLPKRKLQLATTTDW